MDSHKNHCTQAMGVEAGQARKLDLQAVHAIMHMKWSQRKQTADAEQKGSYRQTS